MDSLLYIRLIGYTAGTLLQLFWMVVILGYRRQRNFDRVFFFLCLALFFFYSGSLLALNSQIYYHQPPVALNQFAIAIISTGLCLLPALLLHLHLEYAETRSLLKDKRWKLAVLFLLYAACLHVAVHRIPLLLQDPQFNFLVPGNSLGEGFAIVLAVALAWCGGWERRFATAAPDKPQRYFHWMLLGFFVATFLAVDGLHLGPFHMQARTTEALATVFSMLPILPFSVLIYLVFRHNFLQIGRQKNLLYAISATFLALLYLSFVRRVGTWLEPLLPPEASASILLFVLVIFIEPLQRVLGRRLQETAHREMDRVQRLTAEIQQEARQGNLRGLVRFIEGRVKEVFELAAVNLTLVDQSKAELRPSSRTPEERAASAALSDRVFVLRQGRQLMAALQAEPHGAGLSGETQAALEFLCEQLPGALDLCRLIEEKLQLERELAERERLALVGQMAASISHNLKNPLGSIKTILQVQMESAELPRSLRGETQMVLEEINRLSARLNQLLQFSRPGVRAGNGGQSCSLAQVTETVAGMLRHAADERRVSLQVANTNGEACAAVGEEAANDILTNVVLNAIEAVADGGHVCVALRCSEKVCTVSVEDNGPGISAADQAKVLQPFFTTKARGTGLGLAIVDRRLQEAGGTMQIKSPVRGGRGTEIRLNFPLVVKERAG